MLPLVTTRHRPLLVVGVCLTLAAGVPGCGTRPPASGSVESAAASAVKKSGSAKKPSKKHEPKVTQEDGRKYLDGIPYDVWLDDPLAIVANTAAATPAGNNASNPQMVATTTDPPASKPEVKPVAAAGGNDWSAYIATDQVQEESKRIRNQLKTLLQTPAAYSSDFEVIKMDGAVMAALAIIVGQAGDGVSWKPNAGYIRDYGFEIFDSAKGPAKPNYDKTSAAYENLQSVFSGSIPAGATEPAPERPFSEAAPRYYLMRRMKLAFDALKLNINTEAKLKSDQDAALHELMMLAALSKMVSTKDYSSADEPEYQKFMQDILTNCQTAVNAIKEQKFDEFSNALNVIDVSCKSCHSQYKD